MMLQLVLKPCPTEGCIVWGDCVDGVPCKEDVPAEARAERRPVIED